MWPFKSSRDTIRSLRTERDALRGLMSMSRSFAAAEISRAMAPFRYDGGFSNAEVASQLAVMRMRSREMQKNSPAFCNFFRLFKANVVGEGFSLEALPERLGSTEVDDTAAAFLEEHFWKWANDPCEASLDRQQTFTGICGLLAENWARDGEGFLYLDRGLRRSLVTGEPTVYGLRLRVVRPDAIDENLSHTRTRDGAIIRCGVELDQFTGEPLAYYFQANREEIGTVVIDGRTVKRVPASDMLHVYTRHDALQTRGVPLGHAALKTAKGVDEFDQSELVAAREDANVLGIFKAPLGRESEIKNLALEGSLRDRLEMKSESGSKLVLPQGWDYDPKHSTHPNAGLPAFKAAMLRDIASAFGVEYANFANDWAGVSYSSVRVGTLSERDNWADLQREFITAIVLPVYRAWVSELLKLHVGDPYIPADYSRMVPCRFRGRRWAWVDPMKDIQAATIAVDRAWKTDKQIAAEYGTDFDDNLKEQLRVKPAKEAAGVLTDPLSVETTPKEDEKDE